MKHPGYFFVGLGLIALGIVAINLVIYLDIHGISMHVGALFGLGVFYIAISFVKKKRTPQKDRT